MKIISENIKPILAIMILLLGFGYFYMTTLLQINNESDVKMAIFGLMTASAGYYFGSSTGGTKKDETINELSKNK